MCFPKVSCFLWSIPSMTPTSPLLCLLPRIHRPSPGTFQAGSLGTIKIGAILLQPCTKTSPSSMPYACGSCSKSPPTWRFKMASGQNGTTMRGSIASASTVSSPGGDSKRQIKVCTQKPREVWTRMVCGSQGQSRPTLEPVVHVLIGEPPQRTQESDKQKGFLAVRARSSSWTGWQWRWTTTMGHKNGETTECEQMQYPN